MKNLKGNHITAVTFDCPAQQLAYLALAAAYNASPTDANIAALEAFENAYPGVWDDDYQG